MGEDGLEVRPFALQAAVQCRAGNAETLADFLHGVGKWLTGRRLPQHLHHEIFDSRRKGMAGKKAADIGIGLSAEYVFGEFVIFSKRYVRRTRFQKHPVPALLELNLRAAKMR